eukprot:Skav212726  [mRNA]  locus=scaffold1734:193595:195601:- [translate_table: standard]
MKKMDHRWQYDAVDVMKFLQEQFKTGDLVEALDPDSQRWRVGRILQISHRGTEKDRRLTWTLRCNWLKSKFHSEHVRPIEHTDCFATLFESLNNAQIKESLEKAVNLELQFMTEHEAPPRNMKASIAVKVTLKNIQDAHSLRDGVLSGELDMVMLNGASTSWEVGVEKTRFLEFYEHQLRSLTDLTEHQRIKFQELTQAHNDTLHLSAAAGSGKTFLAAKYMRDQLLITSGLVLFVSPNKALVFYFLHWLISFARAELKTQGKDGMDEVKKVFKKFRAMCDPYEELLKPICRKNYIDLVPAGNEDVFHLKVVDEAHQIFSTATSSHVQQRVKSFQATRTLLLSDASQASTMATSFDEHFPSRRHVELSESVRCTQRIVAGAASFQIGTDTSATTSLGTAGPPLKTYLFELKEEQNGILEYVQHTIKALHHVVDLYPSISLHNRIACFVKDNAFLEEFKELFQAQLERDFAQRFAVVSCEDFLRSAPVLRGASPPLVRQNIVVDTISNARGLELLMVLSIGLDAPIHRDDVDGMGTTRCQLYQSITRAQLVSIIINHFMPDGWLAFLKFLEPDKTSFDKGKAFAETRTDAATKLLRDVQKDIKDVPWLEQLATMEPFPELNLWGLLIQV